MIEANFRITYPDGLNARPATMLVAVANSYSSKMILEYQDTRVTLKSIMGVLSLGIPANVKFKLTFDGDDEGEAFQAVDKIIVNINQLPCK
ncbi:MAG: HPr family phosphocarrier protein [Candidatus Izemoplasmatales bacterium]|jgi:phosphocarrier protein|nr:HPr family phosphocarrier protein [Candidatus Izemoplasmatales bacterium]MDD3865348.1 HPr family phosphocarrier protein [Candidatus Izemoplasmatales bacterium]